MCVTLLYPRERERVDSKCVFVVLERETVGLVSTKIRNIEREKRQRDREVHVWLQRRISG